MQQFSFNLFSPTGELCGIQVSGDTVTDMLARYDEALAVLGHRGFADGKPDPRAAPIIEHIIGYVLGEAYTKEKVSIQKCAYLYNDIQKFTWKSVTVYEPQLPELPLGDVEGHKIWTGEPGAAPLRATAANKGYIYPSDFYVVLKPVIDFSTGLVKTKTNPSTGKEYVIKKYYRVKHVNKYPYRPFESAEQAQAWALGTKLFPTEAQVVLEYEQLKITVKPPKSADMWRAWVEYINSKIDSGEE